MVTSCGAERAILLVPCLKPNPAASAWTSVGSRWTSSLLLCPSDPGTLLINNTWRVLEGMMKQLNIDKLHLKRKCRITALQRSSQCPGQVSLFLFVSEIFMYLNIYPCIRAATLLPPCRTANWARGAAASPPRTTRTSRPTSVSRGSQVLAERPHTEEMPHSLSVPPRQLTCCLPTLSAALDGVPFSLHPKFDVQMNSTVCLTSSQVDSSAQAVLFMPPSSVSPVGSTAELSAKQHSHQVASRHWKWGRLAFDSHFQELGFGK